MGLGSALVARTELRPLSSIFVCVWTWPYPLLLAPPATGCRPRQRGQQGVRRHRAPPTFPPVCPPRRSSAAPALRPRLQSPRRSLPPGTPTWPPKSAAPRPRTATGRRRPGSRRRIPPRRPTRGAGGGSTMPRHRRREHLPDRPLPDQPLRLPHRPGGAPGGGGRPPSRSAEPAAKRPAPTHPANRESSRVCRIGRTFY
jgi:hypothetical protein